MIEKLEINLTEKEKQEVNDWLKKVKEEHLMVEDEPMVADYRPVVKK